MLAYVLGHELVPLLAMDPVLHYYPLLACYSEMRAPVTVWKDSDGFIRGCLVACDPPGRAWLVAGSHEAAEGLVGEAPADMAITLPIWADYLVETQCPGRVLSTDAIAVCTRGSFRPQAPPEGVEVTPLETIPSEVDTCSATSTVQAMHLGCMIEGALAGYCTFALDGRRSGSVDRLVVAREWRGADIGKVLMGSAVAAIFQDADRVVFAAAGDNQTALGVARTVGFRTCYWLKCASVDRSDSSDAAGTRHYRP